MRPSARRRGARVWRPAIRLAHWTLAGCVLGCLATYEGGSLHECLGYTALAVAAWRIAGGWFGPAGDRFDAFVRGPRATLAYARAAWQRAAPRHLGHNPLGAWMVVALLAAAIVAGASGALYATDRFWGDDSVYRWHRVGGWTFAVLVPLHLAGVAFTSWRQRENLMLAMITGIKRPAAPARAVSENSDSA